MSNSSEKVIVLDRDGTIIVDHHYLADPERVEFIDGAANALRALHAAGHRLVIVTNQSGVGRGLYSIESMHAVNDRLVEMILAAGAHIEGVYSCPHGPDEGCSCRKPATGLMDLAVKELKFDPTQCVVIGDKPSDVEFGRRAHAMTFLIAGSDRRHGTSGRADYVVADLREAAGILLSR